MENRIWNAGSEERNLARRLMNDWTVKNAGNLHHAENAGTGRWTVWYNHGQQLERKTLVLDADRFSDLQGFYEQIDLLLRNNPNRKIRYNFSTLHDLLRGGSSEMKFREPIQLVWKNSRKSMRDLGLRAMHGWAIGESFFQILTSMIAEHEHIELSLE